MSTHYSTRLGIRPRRNCEYRLLTQGDDGESYVEASSAGPRVLTPPLLERRPFLLPGKPLQRAREILTALWRNDSLRTLVWATGTMLVVVLVVAVRI